MTTTTNSLTEEAIRFFQSRYTAELISRLTEKADDGELDRVIKNDMIDGDLLTGVDETAYSETRSEYGWRVGSETLTEAFQSAGADVYEGIDYDAIIAKVRNA